MRYDRCAHTFFSAICIAATAEQITDPEPKIGSAMYLAIRVCPAGLGCLEHACRPGGPLLDLVTNALRQNGSIQ